ncbi:MAG: hypothetical protein AABW68_02660 [archaeon]
MTMSVPEDMHERMRKHSDVKWTEVARQAFERKLSELEEDEKDPLRLYAYKRLIDEGEDADELFHY